jgi:hypothetical protein
MDASLPDAKNNDACSILPGDASQTLQNSIIPTYPVIKLSISLA